MHNVRWAVSAVALVVAVCVTASSVAVDFNEIARFNVDSTADPLNPEFVGSNVGTIAWSGSQLYLGGWNNTGASQNLSIVEVLNATATGEIAAPTYSAPLVTRLSNFFDGFEALDISGDGMSLGVGLDDGGNPTEPHFFVFNTADNSQRWASGNTERGSSGVSFDPGFNGAGGSGAGFAYGKFGSGRRLLRDTTTGAVLFDDTSGFLWYDTGGTLVRDIDFDPDSGDMYVRHNNQITRANRTGDNAAASLGIIVGDSVLPQADGVALQNIGFLGNTVDGDLLIANNRETANTGQPFANVITVTDSSGAVQTANFTFLGGVGPGDGNGAYDFDFDPVTQTLALLDFANRNVHIFQLGGEMFAACDFDNSGECDGDDIDMLTAVIAAGTNDPDFDLNNDTFVDNLDRNVWLADAGEMNLPSMNPYLLGDATLDGVVDGQDFVRWNTNKFQTNTAWTAGNFNGDSVVDGQDFVIWNGNKFTQSDVSAVPEPAALTLLTLGCLAWFRRRPRAS